MERQDVPDRLIWQIVRKCTFMWSIFMLVIDLLKGILTANVTFYGIWDYGDVNVKNQHFTHVSVALIRARKCRLLLFIFQQPHSNKPMYLQLYTIIKTDLHDLHLSKIINLGFTVIINKVYFLEPFGLNGSSKDALCNVHAIITSK